MAELCRHCGEPTEDHAGPCKQQLAIIVADQNVDLSLLSLEIASLRWQHRQDEIEAGALRRFHA